MSAQKCPQRMQIVTTATNILGFEAKTSSTLLSKQSLFCSNICRLGAMHGGVTCVRNTSPIPYGDYFLFLGSPLRQETILAHNHRFRLQYSIKNDLLLQLQRKLMPQFLFHNNFATPVEVLNSISNGQFHPSPFIPWRPEWIWDFR